MARLAIVVHELDVFAYWVDRVDGEAGSQYLLHDVLHELEALGHEWGVVKGLKTVPADIAFLHIDSTIVPDEYLALRSHYPATINFGTGDISKRAISRFLLSRDDSWDGRVIAKTDLNRGGLMEARYNRRAEELGRPLPYPGVIRRGPYLLYDRLQDVPDEIWSDPTLVVERFMPELDEGGYAMRTWVFMGSRERCNRYVTEDWEGKAADVVRRDPVEVPPELRAERERLGFDFGKFDFVIHEGVPVLLDANRTPGTAQTIREMMKAGARNLAEGLDELIRAKLSESGGTR